jgi:hypothetical protein
MDTCLCHPNQTTDRQHSTFECNNLDMDKIRSHLDGNSDRILAFKRQWLRMHPNTYKGPLVSSTSSRRLGSSKPNRPNKKRQFSNDRLSANLSKYVPAPDPKKNRPMTSRVYCNICKTAGKSENVWSSHHTRDCLNNTNPSGKDLERRLRDDFKGRDSASLDDDDRSRSKYYSYCATTAPLTDDTAIPPNTLDASSLADTIPESENKDSKNDIMFTIATQFMNC